MIEWVRSFSNPLADGLVDFFRRQVTMKVEHWGADSSSPSLEPTRRPAPLEEAQVVTSLSREHFEKVEKQSDFFSLMAPERHVVAIDIDHPAWLVESSTPGHSHLYVDIPPVLWEDYLAFLQAAAKIGLVEQGYVDASEHRGRTDLRLPWVSKADTQPPERPPLRCCRCHQAPEDLNEYVMAAWGEKGDGEPGTPEPTTQEIQDYVWANEGTLNRRNGYFACTSCYIAMGQPSSGRGWTPAGPDSLQSLEA